MSRAGAVVITGMGAVASIGVGLDAFWAGLASGRTGIRAALRFSTDAYDVSLGATIDPAALPAGLLDADHDAERSLDPCARLALVAAREAMDRSQIAAASLPSHRLAIVMGTSAGGLHARSAYEFTDPRDRARRHRLLDRSGFHAQTAAVADALGIDGPRLTVSTACASSTHALAHARDLLRSGLADAVIVGGVDLLIEETFAGFHAMGAISPAPCAPFSLPVGMSVGEGAGFVVIERRDDADRRKIKPLAVVLGSGSSSDGHHPTAPDPTGIGIARALRAALDDAGITAAEIGYFNAHGTGTEANDLAEWRALQRVLGAGVDVLPVSSTKSYLGHTLGAAGILEIIATVLAMRRGLIPPTLGFTTSRGHGPIDLVAEPAPRPASVRHALKSSSAFGGANAAIVLAASADESDVPAITAANRPATVVILGSSAIAAHGFEGLDAALRRGVPLWKTVDATGSIVPLPPVAARVPPLPMARLVRGVDPRGMDSITRFLTTSAALALADAGLVVRGPLRDRVGLIVGAGRLPWESADAFWDSIRARGFSRLSAPAFSRIVMNAAAGAAARSLSLLGPTSLLAGGPLGGLQAILTAADLLAHRDDADALVAGAADELGPGMLADHAFCHPDAGREGLQFPIYGADHEAPVRGEGAACVVLARASSTLAAAKKPLAVVAGAGLSGPRGLDVAIRIALGSAEILRSDVDAVYGSADGTIASGRAETDALRAVFGASLASIPLANPAAILGASESLSALTTAAAIEALRTGRAHASAGNSPPRPVRTVLIIGADPAAGSAALLLRAP